jgi:glycosyltransferase involved in cell wall biosynthesis
MKVLFLTIARFTDIELKGGYPDLMRKFRDEGHDVFIVAPFERRYKKSTTLEEQNGTHLLGVKTLNIQKTNFFEKGIGTILIEYQFKRAINKLLKGIKFDLILYSTPPITFTNIVKSLKKKHNAISYLLLKDIFPQNAVDLEILSKNSLIYKFFRNKEKALYNVSDYIGCMSPANVEFVLKHNKFVSENCIEINPNCIELINKSNKDRIKIRKKYSIPEDTTLFIYGGNLGKPQGIDFIIDVLSTNINKDDRFFLIIGSGTEYYKMEKWISITKPKNIILLESLPKFEYDELVQASDVGLIFLDHRFYIPNYPSRLLSYLENKIPILSATDINTDIGKISEENGYGYWCESNNVANFNFCLERYLKNNEKIKTMGEKGYQFLLNNYTVEISYSIIMKHFINN